MVTAEVSVELELKFRELVKIFPQIFSHINMKDIAFMRVDCDYADLSPSSILFLKLLSTPSPDNSVVLLKNSPVPFKFLTNQLYIMVVFNDFNLLSLDNQYLRIAHELLKIPINYVESPDLLLSPEVMMFTRESEIIDWLHNFKFSMT